MTTIELSDAPVVVQPSHERSYTGLILLGALLGFPLVIRHFENRTMSKRRSGLNGCWLDKNNDVVCV